ncbi:hypothetical protein CASFOL_017053 [Castilleja foliolosa]|uniref:Uncharacterized protein n=1 Tax=Castilleja foliolosa TaxID=1961234 RepID=A0ABD3DDX9_9LAMI
MLSCNRLDKNVVEAFRYLVFQDLNCLIPRKDLSGISISPWGIKIAWQVKRNSPLNHAHLS